MKNFLLRNLSRLAIVALLLGMTTMTAFAAEMTASLALAGNSVVGATGNTTFGFTVTNTIDAGETIVFTAPDNLDVSGVTFSSDGFAGGHTSMTCAAAAQLVTCTVNGGDVTAGTDSIIMTGITSKYVDTGQTITGVATTAGTPDTDADGGAVTDTTVGALSSTNVEPSSLGAGVDSANTISFTTLAEIPSDGIIIVEYPAGFDVSAVNGKTATALSGLDGTWTAGVAGQVITFTQSGGSLSAAGAKSFTINSGVVNPNTIGTTGTYSITTQTDGAVDMEEDAAVTADSIAGGGGGGGGAEEEGPAAPTSFAAVVDENMHVVLTWTDPMETDLERVQVIGSKGEGVEPSSILGDLVADANGVTAETFIDEDVVEGEIVNYYVRGKDENGNNGDPSETITLTVEIAVEEPVEEEPAEEVICEEGDLECVEAAAAAEEAAAEEEAAEEEMMEEAPEFSDIAEHWAEAEINGMAAEGIADGNPDGTFEPNGNLNRAEAAALLYRLLGYDEPTVPEMAPFPDVPVDMWYSGYVSNMKALEMIHGYGDGTYGPGNNITRAEFTKLALEAYYFVVNDEEIRAVIDGWMEGETTTAYSDLEEDWYTPYVTASAGMGFTHGFACGNGRCFGATDDITRAEATVMLYNIFYEYLTTEIVEEVLEEEAAEEDVVEEDVVEEEPVV
jgi:S-layer family protein